MVCRTVYPLLYRFTLIFAVMPNKMFEQRYIDIYVE